MHITVILVVMLKSAILLPKNSMCTILPLISNHLEHKITLKYPNGRKITGAGFAKSYFMVMSLGDNYSQKNSRILWLALNYSSSTAPEYMIVRALQS